MRLLLHSLYLLQLHCGLLLFLFGGVGQPSNGFERFNLKMLANYLGSNFQQVFKIALHFALHAAHAAGTPLRLNLLRGSCFAGIGRAAQYIRNTCNFVNDLLGLFAGLIQFFKGRNCVCQGHGPQGIAQASHLSPQRGIVRGNKRAVLTLIYYAGYVTPHCSVVNATVLDHANHRLNAAGHAVKLLGLLFVLAVKRHGYQSVRLFHCIHGPGGGEEPF